MGMIAPPSNGPVTGQPFAASSQPSPFPLCFPNACSSDPPLDRRRRRLQLLGPPPGALRPGRVALGAGRRADPGRLPLPRGRAGKVSPGPGLPTHAPRFVSPAIRPVRDFAGGVPAPGPTGGAVRRGARDLGHGPLVPGGPVGGSPSPPPPTLPPPLP